MRLIRKIVMLISEILTIRILLISIKNLLLNIITSSLPSMLAKALFKGILG